MTSTVSPIFASTVNQVTNNGISRSEANEIVRNALNQFQNEASEPLVSLLCNSGGSSGGWLEALAKALGDKLNQAANTLQTNAGAVNADNPGQTTQLSAEAWMRSTTSSRRLGSRSTRWSRSSNSLWHRGRDTAGIPALLLCVYGSMHHAYTFPSRHCAPYRHQSSPMLLLACTGRRPKYRNCRGRLSSERL
jgi:hypothetical protein